MRAERRHGGRSPGGNVVVGPVRYVRRRTRRDWGGAVVDAPEVSLGLVFIVFSSRRRHTRFWRDWSSDVCSSDLASIDHARAGDLVFFDHSSERAGIDHVGVYIGNGKMIAAPQPGEVVKVQDVGTPAVIRRVLPEQTLGVASASGGALAGVPYSDLFQRAASRHGVDASVLAAVASQESNFNSQARSSAGAVGLMQFMPATAKDLGVNALDPTSSIDGAARYLSSLTKQFGTTELALAAYNAGPGTVSRYGGIPPYPETQNYVRAVMSKAEAYR